MNKICFYHKADLDGKCSGAIVKYYDPDVELYPYDYNDPFPWDKITKDTRVYMVDISLPTDDMYKINKKALEFIYIDHHISKLKDLDLSQFEGLQEDGTAACILTWKHLIGGDIPDGVRLLGRYDIWDITPRVLYYQYGLRSLNLDPKYIDDWKHYVFNNNNTWDIIDDGVSILKYVEMSQAETVKRTAFKMKWKGYNVLAMNKTSGSSLLFKDHPDYLNVDILMVFGWTGEIWKLSLYTLKDDINVSEIAKTYSGGGHKSASGFVCKYLPFKLMKV